MNRIEGAFKGGKKVLITFVTGGDPSIEATERIIRALEESGAGLIEIGIPFSDPIAEGTVIQAADMRALAAGCTVDKLFDMVSRIRESVKIPLVFMTYLNPIFTYGKEKFLSNSKKCGIDGIIVPDMPFEEKGELGELCKSSGISLISMIAPTSDAKRVAAISREAEGFLYCVSSLGVTGMRGEIKTNVGELVAQAKKSADIPCAIGFGISNAAQAKEMSRLADGVIIGSAIVDLIAKNRGREEEAVREFVSGIAREL
ncbi:MAG: tryptophan synthase subunit alpha [Clostridiales bacterium]|jgi:tryptophan synthase alpha chain|nr:tryptophan synthase subunit alpha [Clostridiales bacterium]